MAYGGFNDVPLVIDNGSGVIKVGHAEKPWPEASVPNIVGVAKHKRVLLSAPKREKEFGEDAINSKGLLKLSRPMVHGVIENVQDQTDVWEHIYRDVLKFPSSKRKDHPVLMTEAPNNPVSNRLRIAKTFFEAFDVPALFFAPSPVLALYATGRLTGCVLDSGHGVSQCVPIYDGFALPHSVTRMDVAGGDVDLYFQHLLRKLAGVSFHTTSELELVREIKEKNCEIMATRPTPEQSAVVKKKTLPRGMGLAGDDGMDSIRVELPDKKVLQLGSARWKAPELLFDPSLVGLEHRGIHYCILDAVAKSDLELRSSLYQQILLSGGSTLYQGFGSRLLNELQNNCGLKNPKFKIFAPKKRHLTTWVGGSVLATLQSFNPMWITSKEFEEGEQILFRKTFL